MSKTAVIVALLVAVCLGIAALLLTGGEGKPAVSGPLLNIEPSNVTEMRVDFADGRSQAVVRTDGQWRVDIKGGGIDRSWPAAQTQVYAALRIFGTLMPEQDATGKIEKPAGTLTIKSGESSQTLKISDPRLGGRVLVEASGRAAWVDANIAEMLIATGIQAWRDPAAFPGLGASASPIVIVGEKGGLVIAQVLDKWALRKPFTESADPEAVSRLFVILNSVRIVDFCDKAAPSFTGLDKPAATIEIGRLTEERSTASSGWSLAVGAAAGIADNTFVAQVARGKDKPQIVIVAGEQLAAISTDPMHYISKQALRVEPADVGHIAITSPLTQLPCKRAEYRRTLEGWETRCDLGEWKPALKADIQAVEALITLCTTTVPERIELRGKRETREANATIEVGTAGGTPLGAFSILIDGARFTIMNENVLRDYAADAGKTVAEWLGRR